MNYREKQLVEELLDLKRIYETIPKNLDRELALRRLFRGNSIRRQVVEELFAEIHQTKFFS